MQKKKKKKKIFSLFWACFIFGVVFWFKIGRRRFSGRLAEVKSAGSLSDHFAGSARGFFFGFFLLEKIKTPNIQN